jgi:hypothetical protein
MAYWGPRPPGWRSWVEDNLPQHVMLAKQWAGTIKPVLEFRETIGPDRWMDLAYADLTRDPTKTIGDVLDWLDVSRDPGVLEFVEQQADPGRVDRWREAFTEQELEDMRPEIEGPLHALGYQW